MKTRIVAFITWTLITVLAAGALSVSIPQVLGGTTLTVLTGSMQPAINPGDIVAVFPVYPSDLRTGDIVTFQPSSGDPTLITHRIVAANGATFVTRGDANTANDPELIADQIQGRVV